MIRIYNTLTGKKEEFVPVHKGKVRMYVCGPTTYNYFHVGNGRAFLFFDVVRSYFRHLGYKVTYVQNLTDIDDKIINKAKEENTTTAKIAAKYIKAFKDDIKAMGIRGATYYPKATGYVQKMIDFISILEDKGFAYLSNGDVFFSSEKVKEYGMLSGKKIDQLISGARVEQNDNKMNAADFVLWKKAKPGEPEWDSPWGRGRPGWHTECVVMAHDILRNEREVYKGQYAGIFDIHAGGVDLIFPHHENEIAQSRAGYGSQLARYWMHNGFINIEGEKMSKSLGNFLTVREIIKKYDPDALRHFYLSKHYRSPIDFSEEIIKESAAAIKKLNQPLTEYFRETGKLPGKERIIAELNQEFCSIMNDDFNSARASALLFDIAKQVNKDEKNSKKKRELLYTLYKLGRVLGYYGNIGESVRETDSSQQSEELIQLLIEYRQKFKQEKNWKYADMIRDDLAKLGIELQDTKEGTKWVKTDPEK